MRKMTKNGLNGGKWADLKKNVHFLCFLIIFNKEFGKDFDKDFSKDFGKDFSEDFGKDFTWGHFSFLPN